MLSDQFEAPGPKAAGSPMRMTWRCRISDLEGGGDDCLAVVGERSVDDEESVSRKNG